MSDPTFTFRLPAEERAFFDEAREYVTHRTRRNPYREPKPATDADVLRYLMRQGREVVEPELRGFRVAQQVGNAPK